VLFLKDDTVGRFIFGFVWQFLGIVWLGQYFYCSKNEKA